MSIPTVAMWMDGFDISGSVSVNTPAQVIFQHIELSFQCFNCLFFFNLLNRMAFYLLYLILAAGYV